MQPCVWGVGDNALIKLSSHAILSESASALKSFDEDELWNKHGLLCASFSLSLDTKVYAAMGNHDFHPKNQFPGKGHRIYNQTAEMWRPWLNEASIPLFRAGRAPLFCIGSTLENWGWFREYHKSSFLLLMLRATVFSVKGYNLMLISSTEFFCV